MFSRRLHWDLPPNRLSGVLSRRRAAALPILDLTGSNPTHAGLTSPVSGELSDPRSAVYDPAPAGLATARQAVAASYAARGLPASPDRILLTTSTSESYGFLFKLLCDPGDEVLAPCPSYPLFEFLAGLESVRVAPYRLAYHGEWSIDFGSLETQMGPRVRAVVLVNPNNPTGSYIKREELDRLAPLAGSRAVALISDEVFSEYPLREDACRVVSLAGESRALTFCLGGLSKSAGLPQMKLGWMLVDGPEGLRRAALERLELIADTYLSVSTPVQHAAGTLIEAGRETRRRIRERVLANLAALRSACGPSSAWRPLDVEGGWYAVVQLPRTRTEEDWTIELLEHDGVLAQPGYFYDFASEAFLVLSLLTEPAVFREGVARLAARVAGLS